MSVSSRVRTEPPAAAARRLSRQAELAAASASASGGEPAPVAYAARPAHLATSDAERSRRKLRAVVAGLRSRFWGKRGEMAGTFLKWDNDNSGALDRGELASALRGLGYEVTLDEASEIVAAFDGNRDGVIQYDDFVSILCGDQKTADALPATVGDASFLAALRAAAADGRAARVPPRVHNAAGEVLSWAGLTAKNVLSTAERAAMAGAGDVGSFAAGHGHDTIRDALARRAERAEAELRASFASAVLRAEERGPAHTRAVAGDFDATVRESWGAHAAVARGSAAGDAVARARATLRLPDVPPETLLRTAASDARAAVAAARGAVPTAAVDRSLGARARVPGPAEPEPLATVGSAHAAAHAGPRGALPGGAAYDPLDAVAAGPATGPDTLVVGALRAPPRAVLPRLVAARVERVRLTGRMPLEGTFASEGTDSGAVAAARGWAPAPAPAPPRSRGGADEGADEGAGGAGDGGGLEKASDRAAAGQLRNARLERRAGEYLSRSARGGAGAGAGAGARAGGAPGGPGGGPTGTSGGGEAYSLADEMRGRRAAKVDRLGINDTPDPDAAAVEFRAREEAQLARHAASAVGAAGVAGSAAGSLRGSARGSRAATPGAAGELPPALAPAFAPAFAPAPAPAPARAPAPPGASAADGARAREALTGGDRELDPALPARVTARLARAEGARTTFLLVPPAGVGAASAAEPPAWHYATAARLAQTQMAVPEQTAAVFARAEKRERGAAAAAAWEARIRARAEGETAFREADAAQRVERKLEERGRYAEGVRARKARMERALFGGAPSDVVF